MELCQAWSGTELEGIYLTLHLVGRSCKLAGIGMSWRWRDECIDSISPFPCLKNRRVCFGKTYWQRYRTLMLLWWRLEEEVDDVVTKMRCRDVPRLALALDYL